MLITHDASATVPLRSQPRVQSAIAAETQAARDLLKEAVANTRPTVVFAGHWHARLTHELRRPDGDTRRVDVLSGEHTTGNAVMLDLDDLSATPLPELWRRHLDR